MRHQTAIRSPHESSWNPSGWDRRSDSGESFVRVTAYPVTNNDVVVISHLEFISDGIRYRIATVVGDADELLSNVPRAPDGIRLAIAKERNVLNSLQKNYDFIRFET